MNRIQLTSQLGQVKSCIKKNDTETTTNHVPEMDIIKTCIFKFKLSQGKKIHVIENSDIEHAGLSLWRYASIRNNKLSLKFKLRVLGSFTGVMPNKILLKLELLNRREHKLNIIKQSTIKLNETYDFNDIISMEEMETPSDGYVDDQGVFTFRSVVLHVTNDDNLFSPDFTIQKVCYVQFKLNLEMRIHHNGNSDTTHGELYWWMFAFVRNNKLSLRLKLKVIDAFTGLLPTDILIELELLNKRNHQLNKIKQPTIQVKETYIWEDIINIDELENPSLGFVDDQRVFTFRLFVLNVTTE
ncbi:hypothetical protein SNE40_006792 [Patella caerulea]|uniref:Uncharacterized protein n=1 Tax=Patella caerulea TaxID=87958 RepID=A0AAN8JSK9_PATCE